jgi:hypothetical protein
VGSRAIGNAPESTRTLPPRDSNKTRSRSPRIRLK